MTYNEILVNMTACITCKECPENCPYKQYNDCLDRLMTDALEIILTQNFEIKRLKKEQK